jgi:hypothetical protein
MQYSTADVYRLAALASVDWRTAARALRGEAVKGLAGDRLRAVLATWTPEPTALSTHPTTKA